MNELYDVIIIGAGPAGLTAAIYASRANLKTLVLEAEVNGGKLSKTHQIENFVRGGKLRIDHQRDSQIVLHLGDLPSVGGISHPGDGVFRTKPLGYQTGKNV